jgi:predicted ATP-grasp superfamily ATP-dependent carboligase
MGTDITMLGTIRSLSRQKIPTFYLTEKKDFVRWSRWAHPLSFSAKRPPSTEELTNMLENMPFEKAVLFPCSDGWLNPVINLPSKLTSRYPSSLPSLKTLHILLDKGKFGKTVIEIDMPHPETLWVETSDQLKKLDARYFDGFFFKPCDSRDFQNHFRTKGFRVFGLEDALEKFQKIQAEGQTVILQEYIPGPANNHYFVDGFVDREGQIRAQFARRRERIFPPDFGNSSYCVSVSLQEVNSAVESLNKLLNYIDYRGIFSAEFKFDQRDQLFKILEVNARPWWYVEFTAVCGVNVCKLAYQDALKMPVDTLSGYDVGAGLMYVFFDRKRVKSLLKEKKISLKSWLWELLTAKKPIFSWDDPLPFIFVFFKRLSNIIKRKISKKKGYV